MFSTITTSGSFCTAAKFIPSQNAPVEEPPSPMKASATRFFFCIRPARAMPAMTGIMSPSIEIWPMKPSRRRMAEVDRFEPICVASRMRCPSPPESVAALRPSVR